jgi:hypothetical protein
MTLTVEDGTLVAGADSYLSVADFRVGAKARGFDCGDAVDDEIEKALRRATAYIDRRYLARWPGLPVAGRTQSLCWPRSDAVDRAGYAIGSNEIPREVLAATIEAARRELLEPDSLTPDRVSQRVLSERVGPIAVTYQNVGDQRPVVVIIDEILSSLIGPPSVVFLQRA